RDPSSHDRRASRRDKRDRLWIGHSATAVLSSRCLCLDTGSHHHALYRGGNLDPRGTPCAAVATVIARKIVRTGDEMSLDPKAVIEKIDTDELIKVTLDLANIDSPTGSEGPVADYVHDWLTKNGIESRKVGLYPDRPNVIGRIPGTGGGKSL